MTASSAFPFPTSRPGTPNNDLRPRSPAFEQTGGTFLQRTWRWIQTFLLDYGSTLAYGIGLIVAGILVAPALPALMLPCIGAGLGLLTSALVTKTLKSYNFVPLVNLQNFSMKVSRDYPQVHVIAFIVTIFAGTFFPLVGFVLGVILGVVGGFTTHPAMLSDHRMNAAAARRKLTNSGSSSSNNIFRT